MVTQKELTDYITHVGQTIDVGTDFGAREDRIHPSEFDEIKITFVQINGVEKDPVWFETRIAEHSGRLMRQRKTKRQRNGNN